MVDATLIAIRLEIFTKCLGLEKINVVSQTYYVSIDERMQVISVDRSIVPHVYYIGGENGD